MSRSLSVKAALAVLASLSIAPATLPASARPLRPAPALEVAEASIVDLQAAQTSGAVTSRQLVEKYLARIKAYDRQGPALNAVVVINPKALEEADALDHERRERGPRGPLHGVPILVKDNYSTIDMPTSGGTIGLATMQTANDAAVVARLKAAGAVILGKTTLQELAVGVTTASSYTGLTRNPYDLTRSPGGSSGGSGAAVAASFAAAGTGSDTCGSIRYPAAFQNLYGLRSTRGLVSRAGIVPLSSSQDIAGPLARTVSDLAIMTDAMAGEDPADSSTKLDPSIRPGPFSASLRPGGLAGARIGVIRSLFTRGPDDREGGALIDQAFDIMRANGATVVDIDLPDLEKNLSDTSAIVFEFKYELAAFLAGQPTASVKSLDDIIDQGLDHELVDERFRLRNASKSRDEVAYKALLARRAKVRDQILTLLADKKLDALAYPVSVQEPPPIGANPGGGGSCQLSATTGLPAMAVPVGFIKGGLPVGLELMGADFSEAKLFSLAYGWEAAAKTRRAPFSTPPLIGGHAPAPAAIKQRAAAQGETLNVSGRYDPVTGGLDLTVDLKGASAADVAGVTLHRGDLKAPGVMFAVLVERGQTKAKAHVSLAPKDQANLKAGRLTVRAFTRRSPLGTLQLVLAPTP